MTRGSTAAAYYLQIPNPEKEHFIKMTYVIFSNLIIKYTDVQKTSRWSHNVFEVTVSCLFPSSPINKIKSPHQENEKRKERENNVYVVLSNGRI